MPDEKRYQSAPTHSKSQRILAGIGMIFLVLIVGYSLIRPFHLRWGATQEELSREMPGDLEVIGWTRAISIRATPEQIWPWLVQWGQGRGGWYSYDWLENLLGFDIHTADQILPEHQNLAIGDPICLARGVCTSYVSVIETNRWLSWQAPDENGNPVWTFTLGLFPLDESSTRLVVRESFNLPRAMVSIIEIPDVVMEQKALSTLKKLAEGGRSSVLVTMFEVALWFAALVPGVIAGVMFVRHEQWKKPALLGAASIILLLVLTFLFPPLWLRLLLDLGLFAGLAWMQK